MKGDLAVLYRALRYQGVPVTVVNEMELWEVAVVLGFDEDQKPRLVSKGERRPTKLEDLPPEEQARIEKARKRIQRRKAAQQ